jgi:outer membrane protein assembly factor BamE
LTVFFNGSQLEHWRGDEQPEMQPFQIAREELRTSVRESAQHELNRERSLNDADNPLRLLPGVNIDQLQQSNAPPLSDPQALPGAPDDAPVQLR